MSGIQNTTYNNVIENNIKPFIKNRCVNITNFGGIPAAFKSGYSNTITLAGGNAAATCYCTITSVANFIPQATATNVDTDMTNFCNDIGLTPYLNQTIKDTEFVKFMNNMLAFCTAKLAFSTSVYDGNRYLIYNINQTSYGTTYPINEGSSGKIIEASDITIAINTLMTNVNNLIRELPVIYSLNYS